MALRVEVAVAAPLWRPLSYSAPAELAGMVRPLARVVVPLRGRRALGFALDQPRPGDTAGLKAIHDVLDDPTSPTLWPANMLRFFERAAAYYQVPLGQALAWSLPAGLGSLASAGSRAERRQRTAPVAHFRPGPAETRPRPGTKAAELLDRLAAEGPCPLDWLRRDFPRVTAMANKLELAGWLKITHQPLVRDLLGRPIVPEPRPERLSPHQQQALEAVTAAMERRTFEPFLLYGVTGSGKTEVYLQAAEAAVAAGRGALVLAPEISLCLRLEGALRDRLGQDKVAVLHSGLSPAARRGQWQAIADGRRPVVVGARSAVFAPLANPGIICVDEEQDEAYKQSERLRYHARDLALLRGQEQACPVVLGTATPAVTTYFRAQRGEIKTLSLPQRVKQAELPQLEIVDLRTAGPLAGGFLSRRLARALEQTVARQHQAIVFLNRRGFAPALICPACGRSAGCPACALSLTLHKSRRALVCHTCGHQRPLPKTCPNCGAEGGQMRPLGLGTEQVVEQLTELYPSWRIARFDSDTAGRPAKMGKLLKQVADHQVDVVVGTQMITKGHHFPLIALVGVLLMDQTTAIPDYRSAERAYVLLTQVAGRAGREGGPGRVIVQTFDPEHLAVRAAAAHRPEIFHDQELEDRRALGYPPFRRLVGLRVEGAGEAAAAAAAARLAEHLDQARRQLAPAVQVLGPSPAPIPRVRGRYRFLLLIKSPSHSQAAAVLRLATHRLGAMPAGVRLVIDVDPVSLV